VAEQEKVVVPDIGDFDQVDISEVLISVGDRVSEGDSLITLESDKASMEVPAPFGGVVVSIEVSEGDQIGEGAPIAVIERDADSSGTPDEADERGSESEPEPEKDKEPEQDREPAREEPKEPETKPDEKSVEPTPRALPASASPDPPDLPPRPANPAELPHASPAIRRFARELGVDLTKVKGSGRKGRITREDVTAHVKAAMKGQQPAGAPEGAGLPPMPEVDFSKFGEIEVEDLPKIRKLSAKSVHRSWLHVPHVTQHDEADISEMEAFRQSVKDEAKQAGYRLTPLVFLMKAVVAGMKTYPRFNSSLQPGGERLIMKKYYHIGIAVDTPNGLVVPVIRDVDQKSIYDLAGELAEVSGRAREGKLRPIDITGGCFSISSLGGIGGTSFTPIVNSPEVAILGVSRSQMKPVWNGSDFSPRLMLPLSLSYDHRVIDGADAARFTTYLCTVLGDIRRLLL